MHSRGSLERVYHEAVRRHGWSADPAQLQAVAALERLRRALAATAQPPAPRRALGWLRSRRRPPAAPGGVYLWGGVGRGKTWLMDLALAHMPVAHARHHFHAFMQSVHEALERRRGAADPLTGLAAEIAGSARLLALDEFHVTDITDAMLLGRLLQGLGASGVSLVMTSNDAPEALYRDGLQRARFLPAIDFIRQRLEVVALEGAHDYRLHTLTRAGAWHVPAGPDADARLGALYAELTDGAPARPGEWRLHGRPLVVRAREAGVLWCTFDALCQAAWGNRDYLELARQHHTLLLSGIPVLHADDDAAARRFVHLVDTLYDRGVNLMSTAMSPPDALYRGQRLRHLFARTASRLHEMQGEAYLHRPHLP